MSQFTKPSVSIETRVTNTLEKAWASWTQPQHITQWNHASDDWFCPSAENDLRVGGRFSSRMEAKDGSFGFDFWGTHDEIVLNQFIKSTMGDGRKMEVRFILEAGSVRVIESFEIEDENSLDRQREGWQAILDNYKAHTESL